MIVLARKQLNIIIKKAQFILGFLFLFISCEKSLNNYIFSGNTMGTSYTIKLNFAYTSHDRSVIEKGIDSSRLEAVGFGEDKPLVSNDTSNGRKSNRRVQLSMK